MRQIAIVDHPQLPLADGQEPGGTNRPGHGLIDGGGGRAGKRLNRLVLRQRVPETVEAAGLHQRISFGELRRHINRPRGLGDRGLAAAHPPVASVSPRTNASCHRGN